MPSQFVATQQREMAMRNARKARFLDLTGNYNKLYNCLFTKINYTNCIIAATSVK
jgi:hypothetical protein